MKKQSILNTLFSLKPVVKKRFRAEIRALFGSYAQGNASQESDVDILVRFEKSADLFDLVGLSLFLEEKLQCKVDVVPEDDIRPELKKSILEEAIYI